VCDCVCHRVEKTGQQPQGGCRVHSQTWQLRRRTHHHITLAAAFADGVFAAAASTSPPPSPPPPHNLTCLPPIYPSFTHHHPTGITTSASHHRAPSRRQPVAGQPASLPTYLGDLVAGGRPFVVEGEAFVGLFEKALPQVHLLQRKGLFQLARPHEALLHRLVLGLYITSWSSSSSCRVVGWRVRRKAGRGRQRGRAG
jgi:hypothetical protein